MDAPAQTLELSATQQARSMQRLVSGLACSLRLYRGARKSTQSTSEASRPERKQTFDPSTCATESAHLQSGRLWADGPAEFLRSLFCPPANHSSALEERVHQRSRRMPDCSSRKMLHSPLLFGRMAAEQIIVDYCIATWLEAVLEVRDCRTVGFHFSQFLSAPGAARSVVHFERDQSTSCRIIVNTLFCGIFAREKTANVRVSEPPTQTP